MINLLLGLRFFCGGHGYRTRLNLIANQIRLALVHAPPIIVVPAGFEPATPTAST